jgi:hypothetical protein
VTGVKEERNIVSYSEKLGSYDIGASRFLRNRALVLLDPEALRDRSYLFTIMNSAEQKNRERRTSSSARHCVLHGD